jgi:3-oxoacyl-[acyl-carrier-protein] synthase-3
MVGEKIKALVCGFGIGLSWGVTNIEVDSDSIYPIIETDDYYKDGKFIPGKY